MGQTQPAAYFYKAHEITVICEEGRGQGGKGGGEREEEEQEEEKKTMIDYMWPLTPKIFTL